MTKCPRAFSALKPFYQSFGLPMVMALVAVSPVSAESVGWMDRMFTFREDQKPLVQPRRSAAPKQVVQPYYPNDEHVQWSNFYTRTDLEAQDYLSSSASKVMRPAQEQAASSRAQAQGGWPSIAERAAANAQAEAEAEGNGNTMIGEAGEGWGMASGDSRVGRSTRIGNAVEDWRGEGRSGMASRPGDYDYRAPMGGVTRTESGDMGGVAIGEANPTASGSNSGGNITFNPNTSTSDDLRYVEHNSKGQVTKYKVQKGDSLGSISDQPAIYGNWKLWPLIYSANRGAIGGNPNAVKLNQRLDVPRDYTDQQARDAERRSGSANR